LADVRNGLGFAGVKTHNPLTPISKPRGVPTEVTMSFDDMKRLVEGTQGKKVKVTDIPVVETNYPFMGKTIRSSM
jgi:hypothetical protein